MNPEDQTPNPQIPSFPKPPKKEEKKGGGFAFWGDKKAGPKAGGGDLSLAGKQGGTARPGGGGGFFPSFGKKMQDIPLLRGGAAGKGTLSSRLKGLKARDIAFIAAGLSVLILAPLAEFMISSSGEETGTLRPGFDDKGGSFLQGGTLPYEEGIGGIAQGGLPGQDTDVITPLNVRDPASLIMTPEQKAAQQPAVTAEKPPLTPPKEGGWRDVLNAAKTGVKEAVKKARLPKPNVNLANKLNWAGAHGQGGTTASLAAPSSAGLFSKPKEAGASPRASAAPGFRSMTTGGSTNLSLSGGGRTGPGGGVSTEAMPGAYGGPGGVGAVEGNYGRDDAGKSPGHADNKGDKNVSHTREDLAYLARKMNMEKAIDLKWAKKRYDELERKKMIEQTLLQTAQQAFLKILDKLLEGAKGGGKDSGGAGSPGPSGPSSPGPSGPTSPGPGGANPETAPRPPATKPPTEPDARFNVGGSGRGQPVDAKYEKTLGTALEEAGKAPAMVAGSGTESPKWDAKAKAESAASAKTEVDKIKPYKTEQIAKALEAASGVKPPKDRNIQSAVGEGLTLPARPDGSDPLKDYKEAAKAAVDSFNTANKTSQNWANELKKYSGDLAGKVPKVGPDDQLLEAAKKPLGEAVPKMSAEVKTKLEGFAKEWAAAGDEKTKQEIAAKAKTEIDAYNQSVAAAVSSANSAHASVTANSQAARTSLEGAKKELEKQITVLGEALAGSDKAFENLKTVLSKIDPKFGNPKAERDDATMLKLKQQVEKLVTEIQKERGNLGKELEQVNKLQRRFNSARVGLDDIYKLEM